MFVLYLTEVWNSQMEAFIKTHQIIYLNFEHFTVTQILRLKTKKNKCMNKHQALINTYICRKVEGAAY